MRSSSKTGYWGEAEVNNKQNHKDTRQCSLVLTVCLGSNISSGEHWASFTATPSTRRHEQLQGQVTTQAVWLHISGGRRHSAGEYQVIPQKQSSGARSNMTEANLWVIWESCAEHAGAFQTEIHYLTTDGWEEQREEGGKEGGRRRKGRGRGERENMNFLKCDPVFKASTLG